MFEKMTVEYIFDRLMSHVDDNLDKRPGSFIWTALRPCAIEFRLHYIDLEMVLKNAFARTADRAHLIERAGESSIFPLSASTTKVEARFNIEVPIGSRYNKDNYNFRAREPIPDKGDGLFYYILESENTGVITEDVRGQIIPITANGNATHIADLELAEIVDVIRPGEDAEETEAFRARYFLENKMEHYGGNIADYELMLYKIPGVGACKVIPVWDGPGTVKLVILDADYQSATPEFLAEIKEIIDPVDYAGLGIGLAPINHDVTVVGADEVVLDVNLPITYEDGYSWETVEAGVLETIEEYLLEIRQNWDDNDQTVARIAFIEARVLDVPGVLDIQNVTINGLASNRIMGRYEIPVLGTVTAT